MSKAKRYDTEPKLNLKKVFAVIIAFIVIIMFVYMIKKVFTKEKTNTKITSVNYFSAYDNGAWGVINSKGENVIDFAYNEMVIVPNNKKDVFICTYDVNYNNGEYKTKVLNSKNEQIFTNYDKVEAIQNKDENNNMWYEENVLRVEKDGKSGLINFDGKELIQPQYDSIIALQGIKNSLKVSKDGKVGIVNDEGTIVIQPQYQDIVNLGKDDKSGFIIKDDLGKFGIVDYSNNKVLEPKYDEIEKLIYRNDMYVVKEGGAQKIVKKDGTDVLTTGFDEIKEILDKEENGVIFTKDSKYGIMDLTGNIKIQPEYDELKEAKSGLYIAKKVDKYGIIDIENNQKVEFKYQKIAYNQEADIYIAEKEDFTSDLFNGDLDVKATGFLIDIDSEHGYIKMRVDDDYIYYNFKFENKTESSLFSSKTLFLSKKDGKYGFLDETGKIVVDYIYDDATEQNEYGFAGVKKDSKWGAIDKNGDIVQEPKYNLDEYLLVDFIGKWHLGLDINMNAYNCE